MRTTRRKRKVAASAVEADGGGVALLDAPPAQAPAAPPPVVVGPGPTPGTAPGNLLSVVSAIALVQAALPARASARRSNRVSTRKSSKAVIAAPSSGAGPFPFATTALLIGDTGIDATGGLIDAWEDQSENGLDFIERTADAVVDAKPREGTAPFGVNVAPNDINERPLGRDVNNDVIDATGWMAFVINLESLPGTQYVADGTRYDVQIAADGSLIVRCRQGFSLKTLTGPAGQVAAGKNLIQFKLDYSQFKLYGRVNGNAWFEMAAYVTGLGGHTLMMGMANNGTAPLYAAFGLAAFMRGSVPTAQQEADLFTWVNKKFGMNLTYS